jgi:hypothetical protein
MSTRPTKIKRPKKSREDERIRHARNHGESAHDPYGWDLIPRGWIHPDGKFFKTKDHWKTIGPRIGVEETENPETGEKHAHRAYSLGWISIGHGGALNAIAHERVFRSTQHTALTALRKLLSGLPHEVLRIEKQIGDLEPESGKHEDFDVMECDLRVFVKHGKLRKNRT